MSLKDDIARLVPPPAVEKRLDEAATPLAIRTKTGTQPKAAARIQGEQVTAESTDGLFTFVVTVAKA